MGIVREGFPKMLNLGGKGHPEYGQYQSGSSAYGLRKKGGSHGSTHLFFLLPNFPGGQLLHIPAATARDVLVTPSLQDGPGIPTVSQN